jgi:polyvinyl alcohol dehydrogenase (cytochrome)
MRADQPARRDAGNTKPESEPGAKPQDDDSDAGSEPTTPPEGEPAPKGQWITYGFDARNTQVNPNERVLGRDNVAKLKEQWRLHVLDGASSTPAVVDGIAYFGGWNGHVYAVDAISGEIRWEHRITEQQVNATPLVTSDRVYVSAGGGLVALARDDGHTIYEVALDAHPAAMVWSSPKLVDDMLIIGVASFENGITFQPTFTGSIVALEAANGEEIWRVKTTGERGKFGPCYGGPGASVWSSAAIDESLGLIFIGTGQGFNTPASTCSDSLMALDYARGFSGDRIRWFVQYTKDDIFGAINIFGPDADIGAAPNLFEIAGRAVVGAGDKGGSYRTFDRRTGDLIWRTNLEIGPFPSFGGVTTTAAVYGDTIYVASNHLETGAFISSDDDDPADFSYLYALEAATGRERWKIKLPAPMAGTFAIANGVLYHPTVNRTLFARDLTNGAELWSTKLLNDPGSGPSIVDGRVYMSAGMALTTLPTAPGGFVSCFGLDDTKLIEREAPKDVVEPLDEPACKEALKDDPRSAECKDCMCACQPTAAGHCSSCSTLDECVRTYCSLAQAGDAMQRCLEQSCNAKLLPSFVFEREVELAPCVLECTRQCQ